MRFRVIVQLIVVITLLSACTGALVDNTSPTPDDSQTPNDNSVPDGVDTRNPLEPVEDEENMSQGEVFIDSSELLILESYPLQIRLLVEGNLPTPCHQLRATMEAPDDQGNIHIKLYSLVDPEAICIQMLEDFESNIPLGSFPDGSYSVWLNGEQVGTFHQ